MADIKKDAGDLIDRIIQMYAENFHLAGDAFGGGLSTSQIEPISERIFQVKEEPATAAYITPHIKPLLDDDGKPTDPAGLKSVCYQYETEMLNWLKVLRANRG